MGNITANGSTNGNGGYSARVRLRLLIGGREIQLCQVAHDRVILSESAIPVESVDERAGQVIMNVDSIERRWPVQLATPLREGRLVGDSRIVSLIT